MKILIYTDSRGQVINNIIPYTSILSSKYNCESYICPEKWTTTMDFFRTIQDKDLSNYDYIILQTSVVENSPRSKNDAYNKIYLDKKKKPFFDKIFGEENMKKHFATKFEHQYENEDTLNMFSIEMGLKYLVPELEKIPNLIWISNCPLVGGNGETWRGNYWRARPKNIGIINDFSIEYIKHMKNTKVIDTTNWSENEIKKYTIDNMHYNNDGHLYIFNKIQELIIQKK